MVLSIFSAVMTRAFLLALLATALVAAPVKPKTTRAKSSRTVTGSQKTRLRSRAGRRTRVAPAPTYQLHPDPERYQQIQQSLVDRGYFKGAVNGQWNDDSIDALKRFQADQKLDTDGKINALTLTGLGLGPKHDGSTASTVPLSAAASSAPAAEPPTPQFGSPN